MSVPAPKIMLVAGEPSGDLLGAPLMRALRKIAPEVEYVGIGGPAMASEGLRSIVPFDDLSVMGLAEVLPRALKLLGHIKATASFAKKTQPLALITIDSPGFSFRLARRLRDESFKKIHFVAPSVWAWRPGRARKIAPLYDHLLTLLPFEPPYFETEGLPATFVGHPVLDRTTAGNGPAFRQRLGIAADRRVILVLPGSRQSETSRLLPIFEAALRRCIETHPDVQAVVPTVPGVAAAVRTAVAAWPNNAIVVTDETDKADAFACATAALAASGTVALELALAKVPMVIAYNVNALTAFIARRLVKTRYVSLVNILLQREAVPELLLERCRPDLIAMELDRLLDDPANAATQVAAFEAALAMLASPDGSPSSMAARVVAQVAGLSGNDRATA